MCLLIVTAADRQQKTDKKPEYEQADDRVQFGFVKVFHQQLLAVSHQRLAAGFQFLDEGVEHFADFDELVRKSRESMHEPFPKL
jgi:hypothetical protein